MSVDKRQAVELAMLVEARGLPGVLHAIADAVGAAQARQATKQGVDAKGQPYLVWHVEAQAWRAWVEIRTDEADYARCGRYLAVKRLVEGELITKPACEFPIFGDLPSTQVLVAFVTGLAALTGTPLEGT